MRRFPVMILVIVLLAAVAPTHAAPVEPICSDDLCVSVARDGYLAVIDGAAHLPDPADGYVLVEEDGTVCMGRRDGPYTDATWGNGTDRDPNEACGLGIVRYEPGCWAALACVSVRDDGYLLVIDGEAHNPDPADGYVLIEEDGTICRGDGDGPYTDTRPGNGTVRDPNETCVG